MSEIRYEPSDVRPGAVGRFALMLVVSVAIVGGIVLGLLVGLRKHERSKDPPLPPMADREPDRRPPEPRLQPQPFSALLALREDERRTLGSYGVDPASNTVRIPIDEAIVLYVKRAGGAPPAAASPSPRMPTDSAPVPSPQPSAGVP